MDNPRGHMARDLQRNLLRPGMTKDEVIALLGEPDYGQSDRMLRYVLGFWSGFRIDEDSLDVHFDEKGRLTESRIVQH